MAITRAAEIELARNCWSDWIDVIVDPHHEIARMRSLGYELDPDELVEHARRAVICGLVKAGGQRFTSSFLDAWFGEIVDDLARDAAAAVAFAARMGRLDGWAGEDLLITHVRDLAWVAEVSEQPGWLAERVLRAYFASRAGVRAATPPGEHPVRLIEGASPARWRTRNWNSVLRRYEAACHAEWRAGEARYNVRMGRQR